MHVFVFLGFSILRCMVKVCEGCVYSLIGKACCVVVCFDFLRVVVF